MLERWRIMRDMDWNYFFQNIFNGAATLVAGLVAWVIYLYNKRDKKIEAANIILNEIYVAEREIDNINKNKSISDYTFILPSNHWDEFQHLFVKNFDSDELRKTSDFFKACSLAEESVNLFKSYLPRAMDQKARYIQDKLLDLMEKNTDKKEYEKEKERILEIFHEESYWFLPSAPKEKLFDYMQNINPVSMTSIGVKLKNMRDSRWYKISI